MSGWWELVKSPRTLGRWRSVDQALKFSPFIISIWTWEMKMKCYLKITSKSWMAGVWNDIKQHNQKVGKDATSPQRGLPSFHPPHSNFKISFTQVLTSETTILLVQLDWTAIVTVVFLSSQFKHSTCRLPGWSNLRRRRWFIFDRSSSKSYDHIFIFHKYLKISRWKLLYIEGNNNKVLLYIRELHSTSYDQP